MSSLKKVMWLPTAVLYGLGTVIGAGIYVLVGNVAWYAGMFTPVSFVIAAILALFSVLSYAEISGRFPHSAGAAEFVYQGFRSTILSQATWWIVFFSGLVSAWALANWFAQYMTLFFPSVDQRFFSIGIIVLLAMIALRGIRLSTWFVTVTTFASIFGLLLIIWMWRGYLMDLPMRIREFIPLSLDQEVWSGILLGAFLAFYAFIGFEDLVHTAEELKNPQKNLPRAIILVAIFSTSIYLLVTLVNLLWVPLEDLTRPGAEPSLAQFYQRATGADGVLTIAIIGMFSLVNSILVQILMASRLLYGMSKETMIPSLFSYVSPRTHIPLPATVVVFLAMMIGTWFFDITRLANLTTFAILILFTLVSTSLVVIKWRDRWYTSAYTGFRIPLFIPIIGVMINIFFIGFRIYSIMNG